MSRPKKHKTAEKAVPANDISADTEASPNERGRSVGSTNKKTGAVSKTAVKAEASAAASILAKGRGRPRGTANKAITAATTKAKTASTALSSAQAPSRKRGRPPGPNHGLGPAKKAKKEINEAPSQKLDVYVFGLGEYGELGLGAVTRDGKKPKSVRRPRLNDLLDAKKVGVVQLAIGGMHSIALTHDQKILTWGVNDNGALGRDTTWDAPERDADADSDSEEDDQAGLNPKECTPIAVSDEYFEAGVKFVQVVATDSASFVLTSTGFVYGWGTFRIQGNDGVFGFLTGNTMQALEDKSKEELRYQRRPTMIPHLKQIKYLAAGGNHVQALDSNGNVWAWGTGEQNQLGRKVLDRTRAQALTPCQFGLPKRKITQIASGSYHSFAIDVLGRVWAWGLSNFGQTGIRDGAGEDAAIIVKPTVVDSLEGYVIRHIKGGNHHSVACTEEGELLVWGRCDDGQAGIPLEDIPRQNLIFDLREKPRILNKPTVVPDIHATFVAAAIDDSFAITDKGEAYSWGFSANWRTGQGTEETVEEATLIDNTAVKGKKLTYVGCGGQFSVLAGPAENA
ncbi:hypothetical protein B7494_g2932 [Chlorociboria aeruginascens]|nr:hypothetical protein B7494_g2932 [Chlorociboria aeruginascens]